MQGKELPKYGEEIIKKLAKELSAGYGDFGTFQNGHKKSITLKKYDAVKYSS